MKVVRTSLLFILSFAFSFNLCQAQNSFGTILGVVRDQSERAVDNAPVQILNTATGVLTTVRTQPDGNYTAINLIPGLYVVSADVQGFAKSATTPTQLVVNQTLRVDLVLHPGGETQTVQVTAEGALIDTDSSAVSEEVSNREISDLPLASRNFLNLVILSPGVVADPAGHIGGDQTPYRSQLAGGDLYIGGGRGASNGYMIDGVGDNDPSFETPTITPSIEGLQDFRLMNKDYSAEYGGAAAQINVATKSGTNDFHGSMYDFLRNDAVDAVNDFATKDPVTGRFKPVLRYNQFGAAIGGPVLIPHVINGRDKLFFFGNYEGARQSQIVNANGIFPTAAELTGDFSADPKIIYDPTTNLPFPGNKITNIDPKAQALINSGMFKATYTNQIPGLNVIRSLSTPDSINQYMIRVDAHLGPKNSLFARFSASNENRAVPALQVFGGTTEQQDGKNIAVDYTHVFTTNFINDLRLGVNRPITHQLNEGSGVSNVAGIFNGVGSDPATWGAPYTLLQGYSLFGGTTNSPLNYNTTDAKLADSVTWIRGPHSIQAGVYLAKERFIEANSLLARGLLYTIGYYTSGPAHTGGYSTADFLLGDVYEAEVLQGNYTDWYDSWDEGGFIQDNWKFNSKLTLNLGIRYDYLAPLREEYNRGSSVDLNYPGGRLLTANKAAVTAANSPLVAYTPARDLMAPTKTGWQPRVGLSYRPLGNTVVRAGYGIYYDANEFNEYIFPTLNAPFEKTAVLIGGLFSAPVSLDTLFPVSATSAPNAGTIGAYSIYHNSHLPYAQQWNLDLEQEIPGNMVVEIGYIGSEGTHLQDRRSAAQGQLITPGPTPVIKFPYSNFSSILLSENASSSNYNALIARFEKRFSNGFSLNANYTWSKALGTASALGGLGSENSSGFQNSWNKRADYGPLGYDVTQNFVFTPIYELPFGHGRMLASNAPAVVNALIGGWQAEGIFTARTGYPISIVGTNNSLTKGGGTARASLVPGQNPFAKTPGKAFNINAFQQAATGTFGNSGKNIIRGLGLNNSDFSLIKNTTIHDSLGFQLRFEAFNVFNESDLGPFPGVSLSTPTLLGVYTSVQEPARILQGALKVSF
jgi:hypothetical protein